MEEGSPIRNNTSAVLNSTELSGAMERETITISSVDSMEARSVKIDSDSNEATIPYGFGSQHPIGPPSLTDLNMLPNSFIVLATLAVIRVDAQYSPQSQELTITSPISTPPMNVSTIECWDTTHTTTDNATFYTDKEPRPVLGIFLQVTPLTPMSQEMSPPLRALPPHHRLHGDKKENWAWGCLFAKMGECRSTPARHAASPYQPKRHLDAQEKLKHFILLTRL